MTPGELRRQADDYEAQGHAALDAGDTERAAALYVAATNRRLVADRMEQLGVAPGPEPENNSDMNSKASRVRPGHSPAQRRRTGRAIAVGKAEKFGHPVALAITASKWRTLTAYARERLRVSQPALSRYIHGGLPCPRCVADAVEADFGLRHGVWSRVVD